jgi:hypothetical protein
VAFSVRLLHPPVSYKDLQAGKQVGLELSGMVLAKTHSQVIIHIQPINLAVKTVNVPNAIDEDESAAPEPIVKKHFHPKEGT